MSEEDSERINYAKDRRIACKYGVKCYQKSNVHHAKYKHPPKPTKQKRNEVAGPRVKRPKKDYNSEEDEDNLQVTNSTIDNKVTSDKPCIQEDMEHSNTISVLEEAVEVKNKVHTSKNFDKKEFIKAKFLVEMPTDFYEFWEFCKKINTNNPSLALKDIDLLLVGPYDVLADKFCDVEEKTDEDYLIHWRYYHDPPEFQTVLKGDDKTGFHIGYFRDEPQEQPVLMANNSAAKNGIINEMGDNIFAAAYLHLQNVKKTCDPFKKMQIAKLENALKKEATNLKLSLAKKTSKMQEREKKIVTRTFNKAGIVVPYNKKTQLGYRELTMSNSELQTLLNKISKASPEEKPKLLTDLHPVLTYASIATDECDFGTGLELGLNILAHGVDSLNKTIQRYLTISYNLLKREEFAKIAEAHMKNRRKGSDLSIL